MDSVGVWLAASGSNQLNRIGINDYSIAFIDQSANQANNIHTLYAVDIKPVNAGISGVPLPATAWLMMSALMGFLFTRRSSKSRIKA
jgi:hypothetical protein